MKIIAAAVACACVLGLASNANALNIDSSYLIGSVDPSVPSSEGLEVSRLQHLINLHNGVPSIAPDDNDYVLFSGSSVFPPLPPLPNLVGPHGDKDESIDATSVDIDVTDWSYLLMKATSGAAYYYYVGGLTGVHTLVNDLVFNDKGKAQNISHYRPFGATTTSVPDGGASLVLLGAALFALSGFKRLSQKK